MGGKSKNKKRQKVARDWAARVEEELNITARQFGLESVHEHLDGGPEGVASTNTKKRKRKARKQQIQPAGKFQMLNELFGNGFILGKCTFPTCKCNGQQEPLKKIDGEGQGHPNAGDEVGAICMYCRHPTVQHEVVMKADHRNQLGVFPLVKLARVVVSAFASSPWTMQALVALDSLCKSSNETPLEQFRTKEIKPLLAMASEYLQGGFDSESKIVVVAILDEVYFRLYHYQMVGNQAKVIDSRHNTISSKDCVPSPNDYFEEIALYVEKPEICTESFLRERVSHNTEEDLRDIWESAPETNPLLRVQIARFHEGVRLFYSAGVGMSGEMDAALACSKPKNWKKKKSLCKPPCFDALQKWRDACRDWCCHLYSYAVPTSASISKLAKYEPLVEIGSGLGYWASLLKAVGADIIAFDKNPTKDSENEYHGRIPPFMEVLKGGPEVLRGMGNRTLFLCYPPPMDPMAQDCLKQFKGTHVAYVGEWEGDTADRKFEAQLTASFNLIECCSLPNWTNTAYTLTIWQRKSPNRDGSLDICAALTKCSRCSCSDASKVKICRLCRSKMYCSEECARADANSHTEDHALRLVFLKQSPEFSNPSQFSRCYRGHVIEEIAARQQRKTKGIEVRND